MDTNYIAILVCGVLAMVLGFIWFGPLFGKKWMEITGANRHDEERRKEMMKGVWKLYIAQFILVLFQAWVLSMYLGSWTETRLAVESTLWIWAAFVIPTVAGSCMWNNDSGKVSWAKFLLQGGYQLALFVMFALVLSMWG
jgi:hypothetical protein